MDAFAVSGLAVAALLIGGAHFTYSGTVLGGAYVGTPQQVLVQAEWDAGVELENGSRFGNRVTLAGSYFLVTNPQDSRSRLLPVSAGAVGWYGHLRALESGRSTIHAGAVLGAAFSLFCGGDVCIPVGLRGALEVEFGHRLTPALALIVRGEGGVVVSLSFGWTTAAGVGLRF